MGFPRHQALCVISIIFNFVVGCSMQSIKRVGGLHTIFYFSSLIIYFSIPLPYPMLLVVTTNQRLLKFNNSCRRELFVRKITTTFSSFFYSSRSLEGFYPLFRSITSSFSILLRFERRIF